MNENNGLTFEALKNRIIQNIDNRQYGHLSSIKCPQCHKKFEHPIQLAEHLLPLTQKWPWPKGRKKNGEPLIIYYDFPLPNRGYEISPYDLKILPLKQIIQLQRYKNHLWNGDKSRAKWDLVRKRSALLTQQQKQKLLEQTYHEITKELRRTRALQRKLYNNLIDPYENDVFIDIDSYKTGQKSEKIWQKNKEIYDKIERAVAKSLQEYERLLNVKFVRKTLKQAHPGTKKNSTLPPQIRFILTRNSIEDKSPSGNVLAYTHMPESLYAGDIKISLWHLEGRSFETFMFVIMHEIGHTLGLNHPLCQTTIDKLKTNKEKEMSRIHRDNHPLTCMCNSSILDNSVTMGDRSGLGILDFLSLASHYGLSKRYKRSSLFNINIKTRHIDITHYPEDKNMRDIVKDKVGFGFTLHPSGYNTLYIADTPGDNNPLVFDSYVFGNIGFSGSPDYEHALATLSNIDELWGGSGKNHLYGNKKSLSFGGGGDDVFFDGYYIIVGPGAGRDTLHVRRKTYIVIEGVDAKNVFVEYNDIRAETRTRTYAPRNGNRFLLKLKGDPSKYTDIKLHYNHQQSLSTEYLRIIMPKNQPLDLNIEILGKNKYLKRANGITTSYITNIPFEEQMRREKARLSRPGIAKNLVVHTVKIKPKK